KPEAAPAVGETPAKPDVPARPVQLDQALDHLARSLGKFDRDGDTIITKPELDKAMADPNIKGEDAILVMMMRKHYDQLRGSSDGISVKDVFGMSEFVTADNYLQIHAHDLFAKLGKGNDGALTQKEIQDALKQPSLHPDLTEEDCKLLHFMSEKFGGKVSQA